MVPGYYGPEGNSEIDFWSKNITIQPIYTESPSELQQVNIDLMWNSYFIYIDVHIERSATTAITLNNIVFQNAYNEYGGTIIWNRDPYLAIQLTIDGCQFLNCGNVILINNRFIIYGTVTVINNSIFSECNAVNGSAVILSSSTTTINNCTFSGNTNGPSLSLSENILFMSNTLFINNQSPSYIVGLIDLYDHPMMQEITFENNRISMNTDGAAHLYISNSNFSAVDSTFTKNINGSSIYSVGDGGYLNIETSTFISNIGLFGGVRANSLDQLSVTNSTFTLNSGQLGANINSVNVQSTTIGYNRFTNTVPGNVYGNPIYLFSNTYVDLFNNAFIDNGYGNIYCYGSNIIVQNNTVKGNDPQLFICKVNTCKIQGDTVDPACRLFPPGDSSESSNSHRHQSIGGYISIGVVGFVVLSIFIGYFIYKKRSIQQPKYSPLLYD